MYPDLFGIDNFSYTLCMIIGIVVAILIAAYYFKKQNISKNGIIDLLICACFAVASGIIFSIVFENLYELISEENHHWNFKMTFFGGLFGGVLGFILTYYLIKKFSKINFNILDAIIVAPSSVLIAHSIGRIGCFLAGCCYGVHTDGKLGLEFPGIGRVVPTQLIEAIFLLLLFVVVFILTFKFKFKYGAVIYLIVYSVFRFIIEFYRGDERGVSLVLSPSQIWCILLFLSAIPAYFYIKHLLKANEKE